MGIWLRTGTVSAHGAISQQSGIHTRFDSPHTPVVYKHCCRKASYLGGQCEAKGIVEVADGLVFDIVWLGPEDLSLINEDI